MVNEDKNFYLHSGKALSSVKTLAKELAKMPKHVYDHHVSKHKNDFAVWMKHSMKNEDLALKIDGQISKIEMELHILRHLLNESNKSKTQNKSAKSSSTKDTSESKEKSSDDVNKKDDLEKKSSVKKPRSIKKKQ